MVALASRYAVFRWSNIENRDGAEAEDKGAVPGAEAPLVVAGREADASFAPSEDGSCSIAIISASLAGFEAILRCAPALRTLGLNNLFEDASHALPPKSITSKLGADLHFQGLLRDSHISDCSHKAAEAAVLSFSFQKIS